MRIITEDWYVTIDCPDHGKLSLLRDLAYGAILQYMSASKDHKTSFLVLLEKSVPEGTQGLDSLTDKDIDCIAAYYAKSLEAAEKYKKARGENKSPVEAFAIAFNSSPVIQEIKQHRKKQKERAKTFSGFISASRKTGQIYESIARSAQQAFQSKNFFEQVDTHGLTPVALKT